MCVCVVDADWVFLCLDVFVFFFKQKTAYEWRISDWSSDVCSSDLAKEPDQTGRSQIRLLGLGNIFKLLARDLAHLVGVRPLAARGDAHGFQIGRASCRERVCQYV